MGVGGQAEGRSLGAAARGSSRGRGRRGAGPPGDLWFRILETAKLSCCPPCPEASLGRKRRGLRPAALPGTPLRRLGLPGLGKVGVRRVTRVWWPLRPAASARWRPSGRAGGNCIFLQPKQAAASALPRTWGESVRAARARPYLLRGAGGESLKLQQHQLWQRSGPSGVPL